MFIPAETAEQGLSTVAVNAAVSAAVGLAVGLIAFPVRWWLQWSAGRRRENVAAYRDALRFLRAAQREAKYGEVGPNTQVNRDAVPERAWDESLHRLAESTDDGTYRRIEELSVLSTKSIALAVFYPPEAGEDPRGELADYAIEVLTHRLKHRWLPAPDRAHRLAVIRKSADGAEEDLAEQYELQRQSWIEWRRAQESDARATE